MLSNYGSLPSDFSEAREGIRKEGKAKHFECRIFPHSLDQRDIRRLKNRSTREWNKENLISMTCWSLERRHSLEIEPILSASVETDPKASFHIETDHSIDVAQPYTHCDNSTSNQIRYPESQLQQHWIAQELYGSPKQIKILQFTSSSSDTHVLATNIATADISGCLQSERSALVKPGSSYLVEAPEANKNQDCGNTISDADKDSKVAEGASVLEDGDDVWSKKDEESDDGIMQESGCSSDWENDDASIASVQDSDFQRIEVKHNPSRKFLLAKKLQAHASSGVPEKTARIPCGPSTPPLVASDSDDKDQCPVNSDDDEEHIVPGGPSGSQTKPPFFTEASSPRTTRKYMMKQELTTVFTKQILNERMNGPVGRVKEIDCRLEKRLRRCMEESLKRRREELLKRPAEGDKEYNSLLKAKAIFSQDIRSQDSRSQDTHSKDIWSQNLHDYDTW